MGISMKFVSIQVFTSTDDFENCAVIFQKYFKCKIEKKLYLQLFLVTKI